MYTREELRKAGLLDFRNFLAEVWAFLNLPEPTPIQDDIAHHLQHGPRRTVIEAFRGVGKSWITVVFALWLLLLYPQIKVLIVSASQTLADDMSKFAQQIINGMPLLAHLRPRDDQRKSALAFDVGPATPSKDPSIKSAGITGQISGSRADVIIADDIEVPRNSFTHLMRERIAELVKEFDAILKPGGRVVFLGTPQVEATLYNRLPKRGYEVRVWPSEVPEHPAKYGSRLAPFVTDLVTKHAPHTPVDPRRFGKQELYERRLSYGESGYALQFMLDTTPQEAGRHPLRCRDLLVADLDPRLAPVQFMWAVDKDTELRDLACGGLEGDLFVRPSWKSDEAAPYQGTVMWIDPSGRGDDETAYAIIRYSHGMLFLVDVGGYKDGFAEATLKSLASKMAAHRVNWWIAERNYGGGMFESLLQPHTVRACQGIRTDDPSQPIAKFDDEYKGAWSVGMKEARILDTLEPVVQSHRLVVDRAVIEKDLLQQANDERYSFVWQMTRLARVKGCLANDDRIETVAGAARYWAERMNRDVERMVERHREAEMDEEIRKYMDHVMGRRGHARYRWRPPMDERTRRRSDADAAGR